jgi:Mg/Co/Ni transporter MgtE
MNPPSTDKLRSILARGGPDKAADLLQRLDPAVAADAMLDLPFEDQSAIFRKIPVPFAAKLVAEFPYYLAYVLLHSRPQAELVAIVDQMDSDDRMQFIEELPEEAWKRLMDELAGKVPAAPEAAIAEAPAALRQPRPPSRSSWRAASRSPSNGRMARRYR